MLCCVMVQGLAEGVREGSAFVDGTSSSEAYGPYSRTDSNTQVGALPSSMQSLVLQCSACALGNLPLKNCRLCSLCRRAEQRSTIVDAAKLLRVGLRSSPSLQDLFSVGLGRGRTAVCSKLQGPCLPAAWALKQQSLGVASSCSMGPHHESPCTHSF